MNINELYSLWCEKAVDDPDLKQELISVADDSEGINDRFYRNLEFGTGGLRGVIGAGTNRMNIYTVRRATQGFADYINEAFDKPSVAIAYDSRIKSDVFAKAAADEFYAGKNVCKQCRNEQKRMAKPITDFKGDVTATMDDKIKNADVDSIINSLYDTNTPVELTSDDLAEDILCVVSNFAGDIDRCIEEYDVTITEENGKKIKAALEKAEAAIQKMKGNINYE